VQPGSMQGGLDGHFDGNERGAIPRQDVAARGHVVLDVPIVRMVPLRESHRNGMQVATHEVQVSAGEQARICLVKQGQVRRRIDGRDAGSSLDTPR